MNDYIAYCGLDCETCEARLATVKNDNPERQGQGIGKQLLNAVKDYSKDKGLAGIVLYTSEYAPAAKFYEKNGFKLSKGTICMYCE